MGCISPKEKIEAKMFDLKLQRCLILEEKQKKLNEYEILTGKKLKRKRIHDYIDTDELKRLKENFFGGAIPESEISYYDMNFINKDKKKNKKEITKENNSSEEENEEEEKENEDENDKNNNKIKNDIKIKSIKIKPSESFNDDENNIFNSEKRFYSS